MTDRPRPYIPLAVRVEVARRQLILREGTFRALSPLAKYPGSAKLKLDFLLECLFDGAGSHLDHDPSLILRPYNPRIKDPAARYTPNANDPAALVYRGVHEHQIKTNVRGEHGQLSDTSLRMKNRRMDENRGRRKRRPKKKIPSRPFPKKGLGGFPGGRLADRASSAEPSVAAARGWPTQD